MTRAAQPDRSGRRNHPTVPAEFDWSQVSVSTVVGGHSIEGSTDHGR
jgi:hypothetical protein